jgi:hypothetical protein
MSLEMAQKVISRKKKIMSRIFLNSGTLIVIIRFRFDVLSAVGQRIATMAEKFFKAG